MIYYYIFAAVILSVQALILVEAWRHLIYSKRNYKPKPSDYQPRAALISPCKGLDTTFDRNINSLFDLDYPDYEIYFVVESAEDPAHDRLRQIIEQRATGDCPIKAHLVIAGPCST